MTPHELALLGALIVAMVVLLFLAATPGPCACKDCALHMQERKAEAERQRELRHDMQHRGFKVPGMPAPTEDRWYCEDPACRRNPDHTSRR